jgi:hypothetical protein
MTSTLAPAFTYQALAQAISRLESACGEEHWDEAARIMNALAAKLATLPAAQAPDRPIIERALADIAHLGERVRPLHAETAKLLVAFGVG